MNSLKRTLSLVLVLVMVLGLVGVAGAAYKDEAQIQYKEAVGVMTGIGAIEGDAGAFNPAGNLTRAAAAKMVTYTVLGADIAKNLPSKASSFKDVNANFAWAIPSIEYLVSKGVIEGYDKNTFGPNDNVTGNQLAKMLLVALGSKADFSSASWELNTAIEARSYGIFTGTKATDFSKAATREEAALYCFNAMFYGEKVTSTATKYVLTANASADTSVKALSGTAYASFDAAKAAGTSAAATNNVYGVDFTVAAMSVTETVVKNSIAKNVYSLVKQTGVTDNFGRPSTKYVRNDTKTIAVFPIATVATFNGYFTKGNLYTALGENVAAIPVTVSSELAQTKNTALVAQVGLNTAADAQGGNGVITEVYKTGTSTYVAIQIKPQLGQVTSVAPTKATSIAGAYNTYSVTDGVTSLNGKVYSSVVDKDVDVDTAVVTGAVAKDSPVLYYKDSTGKVYIQAVGTITGVLTSVSSTGVMTIDGKTYKLAEAGTMPTASTKAQIFLIDSYGNILKSVTAAAGTSFGLVLDEKVVLTLASDNTMKSTNVAIVATADGTVQTLPLIAASGLKDKLVTYAVNPAVINATVYTLTNVADSATYNTFASDVKAITNKAPLLDVGFAISSTASTPATCKYADANTIFVVANFDALGQPTGTVTTYTGIGNVPNYDTLTGTAYAVDTAKVADGVANVVFIYKNVNASAAAKMVYVVGTYTETATARVYDTIVDGKAATISVAKGNDVLNASAGKLLTTITVNSSGVPTAGAEATAIASAIGVKVSGGLVYTTTDGTNYTVYATVPNAADATPVFVIHTASRTCDALTAATANTVAGAGAKVVIVPSATAPTSAAAIYVLLAD